MYISIFFYVKDLLVRKIVVPLHPLSGMKFLLSVKKAFFEKIYIDREVVQEASMAYAMLG